MSVRTIFASLLGRSETEQERADRIASARDMGLPDSASWQEIEVKCNSIASWSAPMSEIMATPEVQLQAALRVERRLFARMG